MDIVFSAFVDAHLNFIAQLQEQIRKGAGERIDTATVRCDDACVVGKWLATLQSRFGHLAEFQALKRWHAAFHTEVADVLEGFTDDNYLDAFRRLAALNAGDATSGQLTQACLDFLGAVAQRKEEFEFLKSTLPREMRLHPGEQEALKT